MSILTNINTIINNHSHMLTIINNHEDILPYIKPYINGYQRIFTIIGILYIYTY